MPIFNMADLREHNSSPMPGVVRNDDPALDIAREHEHEHVHHSARASHADNIVYSTGTTDDRSTVPNPSAQDSKLHHRHLDEKHAERDIEKSGGYDYEVEKGTHSSADPEPEVEKKSPYSISVLYRRFRLPVHIFLGALFTG